jgi:hypothetical protein
MWVFIGFIWLWSRNALFLGSNELRGERQLASEEAAALVPDG